MEERLIDLEIRITRQEDMIDELNKTVYQQQLKIDNFEAILKEMASRIVELENDNPLNEKPPHY
ncbi:SlyX family protein [Oxalobacter aliiformigenes]|uniref:SlyX family protein n=1 Tax=Oxalobacter aliiformigenes TaxID=2946593 RepID=A0A9E9LMT4_9BURK|nr:SlyX family protein [Oxalobacter aliiformigenes]MCZ4065374.1 SlyX family protein [Oxalobacter aliiformigenes]WAV89323.1 SlyX family protein [Oxalobacter aliiformigenes]WAV91330.1 SlyX family protein [Oxalobacter aliiformigenes]WAV93419.1 SlyX family protein [Oxalobacter aliiformigenes]WAV95084.1 SlyX family protein [Oxalobacter aliiformigenes]